MFLDYVTNEIAYEKYMSNKEESEESNDRREKKQMAQKVLVLGDSGTGKSAALRNFKPEEILVINSAGKPLPFKNHFETVTPRFEKMTADILKAMDETDKKVIVIDDAQYIMSFQYMRRIKENGWDKWNDIQGDFFNIIKACDYMPDDVIVYFLSHLQRDDEGHEKIKTMGKMLDEKITIEGLFTTVLKTTVKDGQYFFLTQNSGLDTVKSPIGMFPSYAIDNDLKYVDDKIRNYYEIGEYKNDEEIEKMDQEVKAEEVVKPDAKGRTRRTRKGNANESYGSRVDDENKTESRRTEDNTTHESTTRTDVSVNDATIMELPSEKPKTRRRKARNEEVKEIPSEEETASKSAEIDSQKVIDEALEEKPKRRRRKKLTEEDMNTDYVLDINDDDLPF